MRTGFIYYQRSEKFTHHSYQILNHRHTFKIVNLSYKYHDLFSVLNKKCFIYRGSTNSMEFESRIK